MASISVKEKVVQMPSKVAEAPTPETPLMQKSARKRKQPITLTDQLATLDNYSVSIGEHYDRWKRLREELGFMMGRVGDVSLAAILLNIYETWSKGTLSATTHCVQCHAPLTLVCTQCQRQRSNTSQSHDPVLNTQVSAMVISDSESRAVHQCRDFAQGSSTSVTESERNHSQRADSSVVEVKQENDGDVRADASSNLSEHVGKGSLSSGAECGAGSVAAEPAPHSAPEDAATTGRDNPVGFRFDAYWSVTLHEMEGMSAGAGSMLPLRDPQTGHAITNYYKPSLEKSLEKSAHIDALDAAESVVILENELPALRRQATGDHNESLQVQFCQEEGASERAEQTSAVDTNTKQGTSEQSEQALHVNIDTTQTKSVSAVGGENTNTAAPIGQVKKRGRPRKQGTNIVDTDGALNIITKNNSKKAKDAVDSRNKKGRPRRNDTNVLQTNTKLSPLLLATSSTVFTNSTTDYTHKDFKSTSTDFVVAKCENSSVSVDCDRNTLVPEAAGSVYSTDSGTQEGSLRGLQMDGPLPSSSVKKRRGRPSTGSRPPYLCSECGTKFKRANSLKLHLRTRHSSEKPYMCKECGSSFASSTLLKGHIRTHSSDRPFVCEKCGATYKHKANLYTHNLSRHTATKKFVCQQCNAAFARKGILKTHMRVHTGEKPFTCKYCGISFAQLNALKTHEMIHTDQRPFTCSECGASFRQQVNLICHIRCHTGERPFACKLCKATFKQPGYMKIHMRSHTGEKPYMCDQCTFRCTTSSALINHKRGHTGEKPYACTNCDSAFRTSTQLARHMPKHTGERKFVCSMCAYAFTRSSHLKTHFKRKHSRLIDKS